MSVNVVRVTGECPVEGCDVVKHQIDFSQDHAIEVVGTAIRAHLAEAHPDFDLGATS